MNSQAAILRGVRFPLLGALILNAGFIVWFPLKHSRESQHGRQPARSFATQSVTSPANGDSLQSPVQSQTAQYARQLETDPHDPSRPPNDALAPYLGELAARTVALQSQWRRATTLSAEETGKAVQPQPQLDSLEASLKQQRDAGQAGGANIASQAAPRPRLVLHNPTHTGGSVHFLLNDKEHELRPGQSHELFDGANWIIRFHRGGDYGDAHRPLSPGSYRFTVGTHGWELEASGTPTSIDQ